MIEETAWVVRVDDGETWVETQRRSSCGSCASKSGCGTSALAEWFGRRTVGLRVDNPVGARIGEQVVIGVPESILVNGAARMYGLPLLTLLVGAGIGGWLAGDVHNDLMTGLGGGLGLLAGFALARRGSGDRRDRRDGRPRILRRASQFVVFPERV